jgi:hypothetical protein
MATGAQGGVLGVVTSAEQECCAAVPLAPSPFFNAWLAMRDFERKMSQLCSKLYCASQQTVAQYQIPSS